MTMASGIYGLMVQGLGRNSLAYSFNAADTIKWEFVSDSYTPNFDTHDEEADITNEVTGTGYTTGGEALGSPTFASASGFATFDGTDVSLSTTTLTSVRGVVGFDDTLTGDPLMWATTFGADYSTTAGTFAITWSASGIWRVDYIP